MSNVFKVDNLLTDTAEVWTDVVEKASWDAANRRQKLGLILENRKKTRKIN
jgi:hypothetical protein